MPLRALTPHYVDVLTMLGLALAFLWLRLARRSARQRLAQLALTVTGYLRPRPNPVAERALRTAFTDLDRELAEILGDRTPAGCTPATGTSPRGRPRTPDRPGESKHAGCFPPARAGKHPASCD